MTPTPDPVRSLLELRARRLLADLKSTMMATSAINAKRSTISSPTPIPGPNPNPNPNQSGSGEDGPGERGGGGSGGDAGRGGGDDGASVGLSRPSCGLQTLPQVRPADGITTSHSHHLAGSHGPHSHLWSSFKCAAGISASSNADASSSFLRKTEKFVLRVHRCTSQDQDGLSAPFTFTYFLVGADLDESGPR